MDELTEPQKKSAELDYRILINSDYQKRVKLEFDVDDSESNLLPTYMFDIVDHFGLPMTNNPDINRDAVDMGSFLDAIYQALDAAGWVSPQDHQRALQEVRRSAR